MNKVLRAFELLEPRILLDGTLDFADFDELSGEAQLETITALIEEFSKQADPDEGAFVAKLKEAFFDALGVTTDMFDMEEGQAGTGFGSLDDVFERVRLALIEVIDTFNANIEDADGYKDRLDTVIGGLDFTADEGSGTLLTQLQNGTYPLTGFSVPDFLADADGDSLANRLATGTYPLTQDTDTTAGNDTTDIDFLNSALRVEVDQGGTVTDYTGDFLAYFTSNTNPLFVEALGDGTLTEAEVRANLDNAFNDFIANTVINRTVSIPDPSDATSTIEITNTFSLDAGTIDVLKDVWVEQYNAHISNVGANDLTDIQLIDRSDAASITFTVDGISYTESLVSSGSVDFLGFFDNNLLLRSIFDGDALYDNTYVEIIDDFVSSITVATTNTYVSNSYTSNPFGLDAATKAEITSILEAQVLAVLQGEDVHAMDSLFVENIGDGAGNDFVEFSSGTNGALDVDVHLPILNTLLSQIDIDPALRSILPVDFEFSHVASTLSFSLSSSAQLSATTADQSLSIEGIAFTSSDAAADDGAVFAFGKAQTGGDPASVDYTDLARNAVGFLEGNLVQIETAQIDLSIESTTDLAGMAFDTTASYDLSTSTVTESISQTGAATGLGMSLAMRDLDGNAIAYDEGDTSEFEIARYHFLLDLPLSLSDTDLFSFDATLTQSVQVNFAGFAGTDGDIDPPDTTPPIFVEDPSGYENTSVVFEVGSLDGVVPDALHDAFTALANSIWDMDTNIMATFFTSIGDGLSGALENANFDLGIPLTDFDLLDGFREISDTLASIPDLFSATPEDFGFPVATDTGNDGADNESYIQISAGNVIQLGSTLSIEDLYNLSQLSSLTFVQYTSVDGGYSAQEVTIDPSSVAAASTVPFDEELFGTQLATLMQSSLFGGSYSFAFDSTNNRFSLTNSGDLSRLLTIKGNGFQSLGFNSTNTETRDLNDTKGDTDDSNDEVLKGVEVFEFFAASTDAVAGGDMDVDLGTLDIDTLKRFESVRFNLSSGDETFVIDVQRPTTGWDQGSGELSGFINAFNDALDSKGVQLDVGTNASNDGLRFTAGDGQRYALTIDPASLESANSLMGVMDWMLDTMSEIECVPGFTFDVDMLTGDFLLTMDPITKGEVVSAGLSIDDTPLGDLDGVDLQATMEGSLSATLNLAAGFNIFDMQDTFATTESVQEAILDNIFLSELDLSAVLDVEATEIQADVDFGMLSFGLGEGDIENFAKLNVELDASLVGQKDAEFSDRISGTQLFNLGRDVGPGSTLLDLLGRFDISGGILIDADGCPVMDADDTQDTIDRLTIHNGDDRDFSEEYAMLLVNFDSVEFDLGGFGGNLLPEPLRVTVGNLFDPLNTTKLCTDFDLCATLVDPAMILEGMIALADLLDSFEDNLETFLPILGEDLPLLSGNSILDQFSFAGDFRNSLVELRDSGDFGFDTINGLFDDIFGVGNVSINLVTEALVDGALEPVCELFFEIDLDYLEEQFFDIPFNFDLVQLLGDAGLDSLLANSGSPQAQEALGDVLTNLVDARSDARLRLDPLLGLDLTLGLDLSALANTNLNLVDAEETTTLDELAGVNAVLTNDGAGADDLRIDWRNLDTGEVQTIFIDVDVDENGDAIDGLPSLEDLQARIQAEFTANSENEVIVDLTPAEDGTLALSLLDPDSTARDDTGKDLIFADESFDASDYTPLDDTYIPRTLALGNPTDPAVAFEFELEVGDPSTDFTLSIDADAGRDLDGLVLAINDALSAEVIGSDLLGATTAEDTILLLLMAVTLDTDGNMQLQTTDFASQNGWDEFALGFSETSVAGYLDTAETDAGGGAVVLQSYEPRALNLQDIDAYITGLEARDLDFDVVDPEAAFEMRLIVNGVQETISVAESSGRTLSQLSDALNTALATLEAAPENFEGDDWPADTHFDFVVEDDVLKLQETIVAGETRPSFNVVVSSSVASTTAQELAFAIQINEAEAVDVIVDLNGAVLTEAGFADALNDGLHDAMISRGEISDTAVIGSDIALSQILRFVVNDSPEPGESNVQLLTTNFAYLNGYDEFAFAIVGNDISQEIEFTVTDIQDANLSKALGFESGVAVEGDLVGKLLKTKDATFVSPGPIAFILTDDYEVANPDFDEAGATGDPLERVDADGDPEIRTISASKISAELSLGTPDGLNMVLALGPLEAEIVDGSAFIGRSGGDDRGYVRGVIEDADGTDDGRYDISNIYERAQSDDPKFLELFGLDVDFETRIDLPFSGALGLLNPDDHGFTFQSTLLRTTGGDADGDPNDNSVSAQEIKDTIDALPASATASDIAQALLENHFAGDARQLGLAALDSGNTSYLTALQDFSSDPNDLAGERLANGDLPDDYFDPDSNAGYGPHYMSLDLPGADLFDCSTVLDLLNDPLALLNGLDMIMGTIDSFVSDFMSDIDLPVVGDNLAVGGGFFRDFRFDVLDPARDYLETPRDDGTLPTTVDLINDFLNAALNDVLDGEAVDITDTSGDLALIAVDQLGDESVFYGALAFSLEVFNETFPIEFDFNIPGIDLAVESATDLNLSSRLDIALGFGLDCDGGFFLLNSTDDGEEEIRLTFEAQLLDGPDGDASPEFQMSIGGALTVSAEVESASEADANLNKSGDTITSGAIDDDLNGAGATAVIGLDLFGDSGMAIADRTYDFAASNFDDLVAATTIGGDALLTDTLFDNTVYISQINFSEFAEFTFNADIYAHLDLTAAFTGGVSFVPAVYTDFIFTAYIPEATFGPGGLDVTKDLKITRMEFADIHLDIGDIRSAVEGVLGPIKAFLDPIADVFETLAEATPINYVVGAIETIFPVVNVVKQITALYDLLTPDGAGGGSNYLCVGTMDFLGARGDTFLTQYTIHQALFIPCADFSYSFDANASIDVKGPGIYIELPILQDPSQALNLMLGKFDQVDIIEVVFNLLEADIKADIAGSILGGIGLPSWAASAIRGGFYADIEIYFKAAMTMGYDLGGLVNFANTLDPERLLDGIYIESDPGSLIDGRIKAEAGLNVGIARAWGGIDATMEASFVDPNNDGKLRLPELLDRVDAMITEFGNGAIGSALEQVFRGEFSVDFFLGFWAGINLPWPLPDLGWSWDTSVSILDFSFGATDIPVTLEEVANSTSHLNIGAAAGNNMSSMSQDGNDTVAFSGKTVAWTSNGQSYTGPNRTISSNGTVINLGEGVNYIDYSGLGAECLDTITYSGAQNDTFILPNCGTHVIFAGAGVDQFSGGGDGTYIIFAEDGADLVNLNVNAAGRVYVIAGDDYGMRDHFLSTFNVGGSTAVTSANIFNALGSASGDLHAGLFASTFTGTTQQSENSDNETITLTGAGAKTVFTGKGDDQITISGGGSTSIFTGAGADTINVSDGGTNHIEAGAGDDLVVTTGAGTNTIYGWGSSETTFAKIAASDGSDIILGGTGADTIYGQAGNDIISGNLGDDYITGGSGDDVISGGILEITIDGESSPIVFTDDGALKAIVSSQKIISTEANSADGEDTLLGNAGKDVLIGGSEGDTLDGGADADLIIGDFGNVIVSNQGIVQEFVSTQMTSGLGGVDNMNGGAGADILVAGGSGGGTVAETITDTSGNNTVFGDFGWVKGTDLLVSPSVFRAIPSGTTTTNTFGSKDNITTGAGNDVIFGGEDDDVINAGTGGDFVFGDLGSFVPLDGTLSNDVYDPSLPEGSRVITNNLLTEGNDTITLGATGEDDLFDLVIGGGGDDMVTSENGGLVFIGDYGLVELNPEGVRALREFKSDAPPPTDAIEFSPEVLQSIEDDIASQLLAIERIVKNLETVEIDDVTGEVTSIYGEILDGMGDPEAIQRFGDDTLLTNDGNVYTVLGGGDDTVDVTRAQDTTSDVALNTYIITDDGQLGVSFAEFDEDNNPLDPSLGFITGKSVSTAYAGNDQVTSKGAIRTLNAGTSDEVTLIDRDIILTGDGNDIVNAGDGLNLALMDNGLLTTGDDIYAFHTNLISDAGAGDGNDDYTGGVDQDLVILGGGDNDNEDADGFTDKANLGAGTNFALGDSGSIFYDLDIETNASGTEFDRENIELKSDILPTDSSGALAASNNDGNDSIVADGGSDFIILGLGEDFANLGSGAVYGLGSTGSMKVTTRGFDELLNVDINSYALIDGQFDGADEIRNGTGDEYLVLGLGDDEAYLGDGQTHVLASEGSLKVAQQDTGASTISMESAEITAANIAHNPQQFDGDDYVESGTGDDFLVLGLGSDEVSLGTGDLHIQASEGSLSYAVDANDYVDLTITSLAPKLGIVDGSETITGGDGMDFIVLGLGDDTANLGQQAAHVLGGEGTIKYKTSQVATDPTKDQTEITLESAPILAGQLDGVDNITSLDGRDFVILDMGSTLDTNSNPIGDTLNSGTGELYAIGSAGKIEFTETYNGTGTPTVVDTIDLNMFSFAPTADSMDGATTVVNVDGIDTITNGTGDEYVILGLGDDVGTFGSGNAHVLGGEGDITFDLLANGATNLLIESEANAQQLTNRLDGDDTITTADGDDFIVLGFGDDKVNADATSQATASGKLHLIGSEGKITYDTLPDAVASNADKTAALFMESSPIIDGFSDGNDQVNNGTGTEFVILGLGDDIGNFASGDLHLLGGEGKITFDIFKTGATALDLISKPNAQMFANQLDGDDTVTVADGDDFIILGLGADKLNADATSQAAATGMLSLLASEGSISFDTTPAPTSGVAAKVEDLRMVSSPIFPPEMSGGSYLMTSDGDDIANNGDGKEFIIFGLGSDSGDFGDGGLHLIGGEGTLDYELDSDDEYHLYMLSQPIPELDPIQLDGNENITSGADADFVILGLGDDFINAGNGLNRVVSDQAELTFNTNRDEKITSKEPEFGGNDVVITGEDADVVILSEGEDSATTNGGEDLVVGDNAEMVKDYINNDHSIRTFTDTFGKSDIIVTGAGNDLILGAYGDDNIMTGTDEDFALGDLGDITFRNNTDVETLTYLVKEYGGDDTISAEGTGDNVLIGQAGADTIDGAADDDLLIGDLADLTLRSVLAEFAGQSAVDRVEELVSIKTGALTYDVPLGPDSPPTIQDDTIYGEAGADFIVGGYGSDYLRGDEGQDFLYGDTIQFFRTYDDVTGVEFMLQEVNFAFEYGGYDDMDGGAGPDILIGGLGEDLFAGNTDDDLLYGDAVAAEFEAIFDAGLDYTQNPTPQRELIKVNFAGSSPVDLVSNSQTDSSTGVFLSTNSFLQIFDQIGYTIGDLADQTSFGSGLPSDLSTIESFFENQDMIMRLAEALFLETATTDILEELRAEFQEFIINMGLTPADIDFNLLEYLLLQVIEDIQADKAAGTETNTVN